ncbi:MAG TPA: hypothetical protein VM845_02560 [Burkholderiaceae bacterium]|jgi:hypothetical protein|nr:hypothetical protein [Burkholderiaceae bacterium]
MKTAFASTLKAVVALGAVALLHGCALKAPAYSPSVANVELLKKAGTRTVALGSFTVLSGATGGSSIGLRGSSMTSPVGADYAAYLGEALRQELLLAGRLDPKSDLEIAGTLMKNDIAAAGVSTNSGEIEARFVVRRAGAVRFDAVKRAESSWESSFVGGIAIPKAQQQYPVIVQQLLAKLLADPQFVAALQ